MMFQKRSHDLKSNVERTFLKRFYAGWVASDRSKISQVLLASKIKKKQVYFQYYNNANTLC